MVRYANVPIKSNHLIRVSGWLYTHNAWLNTNVVQYSICTQCIDRLYKV